MKSEEDALKLVEAALRPDEELVWAGTDWLTRAVLNELFSESFFPGTGVGIVCICIGAGGLLHLNPYQDMNLQLAPVFITASCTIFLVLGTILVFVNAGLAFWLVRNRIYGVTTRRVLMLDRNTGTIIWAHQSGEFTSVSIVTDENGRGELSLAGAKRVRMPYLRDAMTAASLIARTYGISFEKVVRELSWRIAVLRSYHLILSELYGPVREKKGAIATLVSIGIWSGYMLLLWVWTGTCYSHSIHTWFSDAFNVGLGTSLVFIITHGLIRQLKRCCLR